MGEQSQFVDDQIIEEKKRDKNKIKKLESKLKEFCNSETNEGKLLSQLSILKKEITKTEDENKLLFMQLDEARRSSSRSGLNIDYLKNVIFSFLKYFPLNETYAMQLIPVISSIMYFSKE